MEMSAEMAQLCTLTLLCIVETGTLSFSTTMEVQIVAEHTVAYINPQPITVLIKLLWQSS